MNKIIYLIFFLLLIVFCSCKKNKVTTVDSRTVKYKDMYGLKLVDSIQFSLDSITTNKTQCIKLYNHAQTSYFTFLSKQNSTIHFYDFRSGIQVKSLKINTRGPNSVGPVVDGYQFIGEDSILVVSRYNVCIIDTLGNIRYKYDLLINNKNNFTALPMLGTSNPLYYDRKQGYIYISCVADNDVSNPDSFKQDCAMMKINLRTKQYEYEYKYPEIYRENIYGPNFSIPSITFPDGKTVIMSFSADNNVQVGQFRDNGYKEYFAGSKYLSPVKTSQVPLEKYPEYSRFYIQSSSYGGIIADPGSHLYYRMAFLPRNDEDYNKRNFWKKSTIIILNKNFEKVGETGIVDGRLSLFHSFICNKKLYVGCFSTANHNSFKFLIYAPYKKT